MEDLRIMAFIIFRANLTVNYRKLRFYVFRVYIYL